MDAADKDRVLTVPALLGFERVRRYAHVPHAAGLSVCAGLGAPALPLSGPRQTTPAQGTNRPKYRPSLPQQGLMA